LNRPLVIIKFAHCEYCIHVLYKARLRYCLHMQRALRRRGQVSIYTWRP